MGPRSLLLALALAACRAAPAPTAAPAVSNAVTSDASRWKAVEELAAPMHAGPPSPTLDRALTERDVPALVQWMQESGTLRVPSRSMIDSTAALELGHTAIATATSWEPVVAAGRLGLYLVQDGASFFEAELGIELLELAAKKLKSLGEPANGLEHPASVDLVRIVAAEALTMRSLLETLDTPEGRATISANGWDASLYESMRQFWPAALDGARRGEAAAVTLSRMRARAETIRSSTDLVRTTVKSAAFLAEKLDALERLGP